MQQPLNNTSMEVDKNPKVTMETTEKETITPAETTDPHEDRARERGWRPKAEWEGNPDEWRSAREFTERGELMDHIHKVSRENKEIKKVLGNVEELMQRREKMAAEKAIKDLQAARREAIQSGDVDTVEKIDHHIDQTKEDMKSFDSGKVQTSPEVMEWVDRHKNNWFNDKSIENMEMMEEASRLEQRIVRVKPGISQLESLELVEQEMKRKYPHRFTNSTRSARHQDVEGESGEARSVKKRLKYDQSKITPELEDMAKLMVRQKVFKTKEAYFEKYFGV